MWLKVPVQFTGPSEADKVIAVNSALYRAVKMTLYFKENALAGKSASAKYKAVSRKLKDLLKEVNVTFLIYNL